MNSLHSVSELVIGDLATDAVQRRVVPGRQYVADLDNNVFRLGQAGGADERVWFHAGRKQVEDQSRGVAWTVEGYADRAYRMVYGLRTVVKQTLSQGGAIDPLVAFSIFERACSSGANSNTLNEEVIFRNALLHRERFFPDAMANPNQPDPYRAQRERFAEVLYSVGVLGMGHVTEISFQPSTDPQASGFSVRWVRGPQD